jgi:hypothetical protein
MLKALYLSKPHSEKTKKKSLNLMVKANTVFIILFLLDNLKQNPKIIEHYEIR